MDNRRRMLSSFHRAQNFCDSFENLLLVTSFCNKIFSLVELHELVLQVFLLNEDVEDDVVELLASVVASTGQLDGLHNKPVAIEVVAHYPVDQSDLVVGAALL